MAEAWKSMSQIQLLELNFTISISIENSVEFHYILLLQKTGKSALAQPLSWYLSRPQIRTHTSQQKMFKIGVGMGKNSVYLKVFLDY